MIGRTVILTGLMGAVIGRTGLSVVLSRAHILFPGLGIENFEGPWEFLSSKCPWAIGRTRSGDFGKQNAPGPLNTVSWAFGARVLWERPKGKLGLFGNPSFAEKVLTAGFGGDNWSRIKPTLGKEGVPLGVQPRAVGAQRARGQGVLPFLTLAGKTEGFPI